MNAYELADELQELDSRLHLIDLFKSANMLRQQADRIAELEKLVHQRFDDGKRLGVIETEDRLKQQSAEPVAWTNQKWLDGIAKEPQLFQPLFVHGKQTEHNTIPLYTAPQIKELSDEEIKAIANNLTCTPDKNWNVLFAKAILKKASEK